MISEVVCYMLNIEGNGGKREMEGHKSIEATRTSLTSLVKLRGSDFPEKVIGTH